MEKIIWHRFKSRLVNYIEEEAYKYDDFTEIIDKLSQKDTPDENNWRFAIIDAGNLQDFPEYIKPIVERFTPLFFEDFPIAKKLMVLKVVDK
nr:MAG TPA: hypothetical protein [Bacteriophage sp.]